MVALTDRISQLIENEELRAEMGKAGQQRYDMGFTLDRMVGETLAVYQGVLGQAS